MPGRIARVFDALIFDMGDVFYDATIWRKWLTGYLRNHGLDISYPELCHRWERYLVPVYTGRVEYWDVFRSFISDLGLTQSQAAQLEAAALEKSLTIEKRTLFDGVYETIQRLVDFNIKLAILSDTESKEDQVRRRLAALSIEDMFRVVVTSIDIGYTKPDPQAYSIALEKLATPKNRTAFVGHDKEELQGALDFGMTAIAYNFEQDVPATYHIWHFSELLRLASE